MDKQQKKYIYILLTRTSTILSRIVHLITADDYTHVSIAFNENLHPLYSSSRKNGRTLFPAGPCTEKLNKGFWKSHRHVPCAVYKLEVTEEVYKNAQIEIEKILNRADEYHFNIIGLILCRMNIPYNRKRNYFCSQFVSEILGKSKAIKLPKQPCLMRPSDYMKLPELTCCYIGYLNEFQRNLNYKKVVQYM
ncbi:MAG: hypothetical protein IJ272_05500 [Clostridia bacterium]|nr:hypothetical protein [Clostridia bacterium]